VTKSQRKVCIHPQSASQLLMWWSHLLSS
jgi:hypothetical protein